MRPKLLLAFMIIINSIPQFAHSQNIEYVGSTLWSEMSDMAISGNYAYCTFHSGLMICNITDINAPSIIGQLYLSGYPADINIQGDFAYVTDGSTLFTINISNPITPELVGCYYTSNYISDIYIDGSFAYLIIDQLDQFQIIDISNPGSPSLIGVSNIANANAVVTDSNNAYVVTDFGLTVLNISDHTVPMVIGTLNLYTKIWDIAISGNYVYMPNYQRLFIVDISNPSEPRLNGSCVAPSFSPEISICANKAYVTGCYGLEVINIDDPSLPFPEGLYRSIYGIYGVSIYNEYVVINESFVGLLFLNMATPSSPEVMSCYYTNSIVDKFAVYGNYVYAIICQGDTITDHYDSYLETIDVSDKSFPQIVNRSSLFTGGYDISISGEYAYIAAGDSGIMILSISNPAEPLFYSNYHGAAFGLQIVGNRMFVLGSSTVDIIDISSPSDPVLLGSFSETDGLPPVMLNISGSYVYLISGQGQGMFIDYELNILDVSDLHNPILVERLSLNFEPYDLEIAGNYAFIIDVGHELDWEIFTSLFSYDISIPENPQPVDTLYFSGFKGGIDIAADYAFVSADNLNIVDISDPEHMSLVYNYESSLAGHRILVSDQYIYLASDDAFQIFQYTPEGIIGEGNHPEAYSLPQNYPNPFNAQTTIQYYLESPTNVSIDILDILGRKIQTLTPGVQAAGIHNLIWDGNNYSSGIYFYRVNSGAYSEINHMTLLK